MLRVAASRVGPLALRLTEGVCYFQEGGRLITGGLVNVPHRKDIVFHSLSKPQVVKFQNSSFFL